MAAGALRGERSLSSPALQNVISRTAIEDEALPRHRRNDLVAAAVFAQVDP
jgi:DNA-directed RNA polymerase subunit H (RpoH/RPB5)